MCAYNYTMCNKYINICYYLCTFLLTDLSSPMLLYEIICL